MSAAQAAVFREIDNSIQKHKNMLSDILIGMAISTEAAEGLASDTSTKQQITELENTMKEYIDLEENLKIQIEALSEVKRAIQRGDRSHMDQLLDSNLKTQRSHKEHNKNNFKQHPKYKEFQQKVWAVNNPDEPLPEEEGEDLVVMTQQEKVICPVTRKEMEEPLKNTVCGHTYSKAGITSLLRGKRSNPCPVAGCNKQVSMSTLERDVEAELQVKQNKRNKGKKKKNEDEVEITDL
eukprot:TRINITY_DN5928_c0_g2_i1.p1 TRINITY_DN5928_c0_g2~~TRINITY_DN5928_c0_g2_i1.p1  ORF type:complete len:237 (+),score=66.29 TRINITY_DN5928_c0_g2_i1:166-876(+)